MTDTNPTPPAVASGPLKILMGADTFPPDVNGAANFASRLSAELTAKGHDVQVEAPAFSSKHGVFVEEHDGAEFAVHRVYSWRWLPHPWIRFVLPWRSQAHAARILDSVKPDAVHIQSHIVIGRGLARQAKKRGIRIVATNHFMPENIIEHSLLPKFLWPLAVRLAWRDAKKTYDLCDAVTTPTRKAADYLQKETDIAGVHAVSCGIRADLYTSLTARPDHNTIVFVGRIAAEKHLDVLVRGFAKLDPALDARLRLVGGGEHAPALKKLATELGVVDRVHFTGFVSNDELRAELTKATVFSIPSIAELQSIATMEAMASGLPVVAANAMALPHLVHDGENGYLFEPENPDDLAAKLTRVLTASDTDYLGFKKASLKGIQAHDIERTITVFESLYRGESVIDPVTEVSPEEPGN